MSLDAARHAPKPPAGIVIARLRDGVTAVIEGRGRPGREGVGLLVVAYGPQTTPVARSRSVASVDAAVAVRRRRRRGRGYGESSRTTSPFAFTRAGTGSSEIVTWNEPVVFWPLAGTALPFRPGEMR
jgi:hypothetical protein